MQPMPKLVAVFAAVMVLLIGTGTANARPQYRTIFQKQYPQVAANTKITCFTCHAKVGGKVNPRLRNSYGEALGKNLPMKNLKDIERIKAALIETEKVVYNPEDGTTYGDMLKKGLLPYPEK